MRLVSAAGTQGKAPLDVSLTDASPEYARLVAQRAELMRKRGAVAQKLDSLPFNSPPPDDAPKMRPGVMALLGMKPGQETEPSLGQTRHELERELADTDEALRILAEQMRPVRLAASNIVCQRIADEHHRRIVAVCEAVVELGQRHGEVVDLQDELMSQEANWAQLGSVHQSLIGDPRRGNGGRGAAFHLRQYLVEAVEAGHFSWDKLPPGWRPGP